MNYTQDKLNGFPLAIITGGIELTLANEKAQQAKEDQAAIELYQDILEKEHREAEDIINNMYTTKSQTTTLQKDIEKKAIRKERIIQYSVIALAVIGITGFIVIKKGGKK